MGYTGIPGTVLSTPGNLEPGVAAAGGTTSITLNDSGTGSNSMSITAVVPLFDTGTAATNVTQDVTPPSVPTGLTVDGVGQTYVDLSWTASTDNVAVTGYEVLISRAGV